MRIGFIRAFLVLLLVLPAARAAERTVWLIHSYHNGFAWTDSVHHGFVDAIHQLSPQADIVVEYLDALRARGYKSDYRSALVRILEARARDRRPEAIVVSDNDALDFVLRERAVLAAGVPIVFCGINGFDPALLGTLRDVTGVAEEVSWDENLALIQRWFPGRRIVWLGNSTVTSEANIRGLREAVKRTGSSSRIGLEVYRDEPIDKLVERVRSLSDDAVVFYAAYPRDAFGNMVRPSDAVALVSGASPVPVFTAWDFFHGSGALGGRLVTGRSQGAMAANLLARVLRGESAGSIPVVVNSPNEYVFDFRQLKRFGLENKELPTHAKVINRPTGVLHLTQNDIALIATSGSVLLFLMLVFWANMRRKIRSAHRLFLSSRSDRLTGLGNQVGLLDDFERHRRRRYGAASVIAILLVDIDRFRDINHSLGYAVGDSLLVSIGERLQASLDSHCEVYRLVGNQFAVLNVIDREHSARIAALAKRIMALSSEPVVTDRHSVRVAFSCGISLFPDDGRDGLQILRNAEMAMHQIKASGGNNYRCFDKMLSLSILRQIEVHQHLVAATERGEMSVFLQPQYCATNRLLVGAEALLRWNSTAIGAVSPAEFIPIAESSGMIVTLGEWVIEQTLSMMRRWKLERYRPVPVAVNVSVIQLRQNGFSEFVIGSAKKHDMDPSLMEIEITESVFIEADTTVSGNIANLRRAGFRIAIDDFGVGYSNMGYLLDSRVDRLKIDMSFVQKIVGENRYAAVVATIIQLAKKLELDTIAEGVETEVQLTTLASMGCDVVQGFFFNRPLAQNEFEKRFFGGAELSRVS